MIKIWMIILTVALLGCKGSERIPPGSFVQNNPNWVVIKPESGQTRADIWIKISDLLAKTYDIEIVNKDIGYIRTAWTEKVLTNEKGREMGRYANRAIIKMDSAGTMIELKTEAKWYNGVFWQNGYDSSELGTLKTDLSAIISNIAK